MKFLLTAILFSTRVSTCLSQTPEDNIIIEEKKQVFEYVSSSESKVLIEERTETNYKCLKWTESLIVRELYDNDSEINNFSARLGNIRIAPVYQMYEQDGIFYDDTKICWLTLPFSQKNQTAISKYRKTYNDISLFTGALLFEHQFIKHKEVEIIVPSWMTIDIIEKNFSNNIKKEIKIDPHKGSVHYLYTMTDHPAIIPEEGTTAYYMTEPYLIIIPRKAVLKKSELNFFNSYDDVYDWCKNRTDMVSNDDVAVGSFTKQLISSCNTDEEKMTSIYNWVQNNIRYLANVYGLAGWIPDNAQDVLKKRYGDCKGKSNLLKSMLQSAGFDARLVWIGTKDIYSDTTITLPLFNHVICAVFTEGEITYLDPTVQYMPIGEYHDAIEGRPTMIENGKNYIIGKVPRVMANQNTDSLFCTYNIEGNSLFGKASITLTGQSKHTILSQIYSLESSRRINILKQFLEKKKSEDKVSDIVIEDGDLDNKILKISYNELRNGSITSVDDEIYIDLDSRQEYSTSEIDTVKRKTDLKLPFKKKVVCEEQLQIPIGYEVVQLPSHLFIDTDNYLFNLEYKVDGDRIYYRKEIELKNTWIKKQHFGSWNNDIKQLKKSYKEQIVLRKS